MVKSQVFLLLMFPSMQVLQRLHESPNVLQAIRAVFIAKASFSNFEIWHAMH